MRAGSRSSKPARRPEPGQKGFNALSLTASERRSWLFNGANDTSLLLKLPLYFLSIRNLYTFDLTLEGIGRFCSLNSDSGKEQWCIDNPDQRLMVAANGFIAASDTAVFILASPGGKLDPATIYALNKKDGSVLWSTPYDGTLSY